MAVYVYKDGEEQLIEAHMLDQHLTSGWSVTNDTEEPGPEPEPEPEEGAIEETEKALKDAIKDKIETMTGRRPGNRSTLESLEKTLKEIEGEE